MITLDPWQLGASMTLVVIAIGLSLWQRLGQEWALIEATVRAFIQLLLVGFALTLVFRSDISQLWAVFWVVAMCLVAALTLRRRLEHANIGFWTALGAFVVALVVGDAVLFGLRIYPFEARAIIPLSGMIVGNSLAAAVLVVRRLVEEFRDKRDEVEARLALGLSTAEAARPHVRNAVRTAMTPQIETTKAVGLIVLPGAMMGLLLAGSKAADAVMIQLTIMYLVLGAVATVSAALSAAMWRRLFTPDQRLVLDR